MKNGLMSSVLCGEIRCRRYAAFQVSAIIDQVSMGVSSLGLGYYYRELV